MAISKKKISKQEDKEDSFDPYIKVNLQQVEELAQVCEKDKDLAHNLGMSERTFYYHCQKLEGFKEACDRGRAKANAFVASSLLKAVKNGNVAAMIFWLKSRAGWSEKQSVEVTGKDGGAIKTEVNSLSLDKLIEVMNTNNKLVKSEMNGQN